jgi:hypothetical protein
LGKKEWIGFFFLNKRVFYRDENKKEKRREKFLRHVLSVKLISLFFRRKKIIIMNLSSIEFRMKIEHEKRKF